MRGWRNVDAHSEHCRLDSVDCWRPELGAGGPSKLRPDSRNLRRNVGIEPRRVRAGWPVGAGGTRRSGSRRRSEPRALKPEDRKRVAGNFASAVNMAAGEIDRWLRTPES